MPAGSVKARWVIPVVLVVVIVTAVAGFVARQLYAAPDPDPPSAILPNERAIPPDQQPGSPTVQATKDATAHPLYETVRQLLQTYFDAINGQNYRGWRAAVTTKRAQNQPEDQWRTAYKSTRDGSIVVHRIESGAVGSARVMLGFTSVQNLEDAPLELPERCIRWKVVFPVTIEDREWKLDSGPTSATPQHQKC